MTNEEKQLLLTDLCARLPYGVKIQYGHTEYDLYSIGTTNVIIVRPFMSNLEGHPIETIKPYLRPMSSMTAKEYDCFVKILGRSMVCRKCYDWHEQWIQSPSVEEYLNAHHFDYRRLIRKGLALEAPEGMYDIK